MDLLPTLGDALAAVDRFLMLHAATAPAAARDAILAASTKVSPVDKLVGIAEALYAARADLDAGALTIAGQVIEFCTRNGWHGLANDARGERMVAAIRRDLGEPHPSGGEWPAAGSDPEPHGTAAGGTPFIPMMGGGA